ncbi:MAG: GNAT family N-acetyltransferase [Candidatus Methylopumilus sp.]|jgi:hypothetical protein
MQIAPLSTAFQQNLYTSERSFTAAKYEEAIWDRLLPGDVESYRYHLAFEISKVKGFKTGYAAVRRGGIVVLLAPYFITDYVPVSPSQGVARQPSTYLHNVAAGACNSKWLCVGSPVTNSGKLGITRDYPFDPDMISALNQQLEAIAARENISCIAFRDILQSDAEQLMQPLKQLGFTQTDNVPITINTINFTNIDDYLQSQNSATQKDLRYKLEICKHVQIEEFDGVVPELDAIYQLYLNCYARSELKFEKLTPEFFESIAALMPNQCRYVLYRAEGQLIGFNLLLHRNGILLDKYRGLDYGLSQKYNLDLLSWVHNIEMCIRDKFHSCQSRHADFETKIKLGAKLQKTHTFLRQRNHLLEPVQQLKIPSLTKPNFDHSIPIT